MISCLAYLAKSESDAELTEWFQHRGVTLEIAHDRLQLLNQLHRRAPANILVELRRLSDVHLLRMVKERCPGAEITLLASPSLKVIIEALRDDHHPIVESRSALAAVRNWRIESNHTGGNDA